MNRRTFLGIIPAAIAPAASIDRHASVLVPKRFVASNALLQMYASDLQVWKTIGHIRSIEVKPAHDVQKA